MSASYNFALEAQRMLGSGQAAEAVRLCEQGLDMYPDYATAYAILARAYLQMNDIDGAFHAVERGLQRFPTNKALVMLDDDLRPMSFMAARNEPSAEANTLTQTTKDSSAFSLPKQEGNAASAFERTSAAETLPQSHLAPPSIERIDEEGDVGVNISSVSSLLADAVTNKIDTSEIVSDALSNIDDDNDNWAGVSELAEEEVEEIIVREIVEEEQVDAALEHNPDVIQSDALSNIDDDNDNWAGASELAEEKVEEIIVHEIAEEARIDAELEHNPDIIQSDALSNIDDDNDNWKHVSELAEEEAEVRLLQEIIEQEIDSREQEEMPSDVISIASLLASGEESALSEDQHVADDVVLETGLETGLETIDDSSSAPEPLAATDTVLAFGKIKVVDGDTIVVDKELAEKIARHPAPQLRIIETAKLSERAMRTLRSSNLRLIPGLEYTPLRIESLRKSHRHIPQIPEPPPFPAIRGSRMSSPMMPPFVSHVSAMPDLESSLRQRFDIKPETPSSERKLSPLEELAQRLERARIPAITTSATTTEESEAPQQQPAQPLTDTPMMVSETMAMIYEQQGALDQALKAYRQLAREKPAKAEHYEQRASAIHRKLNGGD